MFVVLNEEKQVNHQGPFLMGSRCRRNGRYFLFFFHHQAANLPNADYMLFLHVTNPTLSAMLDVKLARNAIY